MESAIQSLLSQDFDDFELIISDNGSTDGTAEICRDYAAKDSRIAYHRSETALGQVWNFNHVFTLSSGTYFMWASDHDLWAPTFISSCVRELERGANAVLCVCPVDLIDTEGNILERYEHSFDTRHLDLIGRLHATLWRLRWHSGSGAAIYGLMRAESLRRTRLQRNTPAPDWVVLLELSVLGAFVEAQDTLFSLRQQHPPGRTLRGQWETLHPANRYRKRYRPYASMTAGMVTALLSCRAPIWARPILVADALYVMFRRFGHQMLTSEVRKTRGAMAERV